MEIVIRCTKGMSNDKEIVVDNIPVAYKETCMAMLTYTKTDIQIDGVPITYSQLRDKYKELIKGDKTKNNENDSC